MAFRARLPAAALTIHLHNTRGMGLANALAARQAGVTRFDAAAGGLGGCPYAPGASGNVSTEELVHMFAAMGVETGVDLGRLLQAVAGLPDMIGRDPGSQLLRAGPRLRAPAAGLAGRAFRRARRRLNPMLPAGACPLRRVPQRSAPGAGDGRGRLAKAGAGRCRQV